MNSFKGKEQNFKFNTILNWKPVKLYKTGVMWLNFGYLKISLAAAF